MRAYDLGHGQQAMEILDFLIFMRAYDLRHGQEAIEILDFLIFMRAYDLLHGQEDRNIGIERQCHKSYHIYIIFYTQEHLLALSITICW